jgi:sugar-specific transcriptional regulator TrmB
VNSEESMVQTLIQLDLTVLESRIYIALSKFQSLTTKELNKITKTSQPDIYRVLDKLHNKGLVEKIIEKPTRFKAVPLEKGISYLVERKKAEYNTLMSNADLLIHTLEEERSNKKPAETLRSKFIMIPQRELVVSKIRDAIDGTAKSVDISLSWKRLFSGMTDVFIKNCKRAWKRGVHFRIVVESPEERAAQKKALKFSKISPFCEIRFIKGNPKTVTGIYDRKEVFIIVDPTGDLFDSPALWSNSQSLITAIQEYFDLLWLTSMQHPNEKSDIIFDKAQE